MNIENNKELLLKPCIQRIEELYQDNKMLVEKYKEFFTNYYMSNEIARQFKRDILELEKENIRLKDIIKDKNDEIYELKSGNIDGPKLLDVNKYKEYVNKENTDNNNVNEIDSLDIKEKVIELNIKETEEYKKLQIELKELKEDYIKIQTKKEKVEESDEYIELKNNYEELLNEKDLKIDKSDEKDELITELQKKVDILTSKIETKIVSNTPKKRDLILDKYPITIYKDTEKSIVKQMVASRCAYLIKYQYEIAKKTNKDNNDITLDETIDYIIEQENLSSQSKTKLKYEFERCVFLHEKYKDKLNVIKFSISSLGYISKKDWDLWIGELDKIIETIYPEQNIQTETENKCKYIYKKGMKKGKSCNSINCNIHLEINWLFGEITDYKYDSAYESDESDNEDNLKVDKNINICKDCKKYEPKLCGKCFEEFQLKQNDNYEYEDDYEGYESNEEDNIICEWNKDDIHRDYCYLLKENNEKYCRNHIIEDIDKYLGLEHVKYMLYIEKKIDDDMYLDLISYIISIESNFIIQKYIENMYIKEIEILNNIDIYISDKYYINKYERFDMKETIKDNMGLCYEYNCYNRIEINEDHCRKHIDEQNIDEYDENGIKIIIEEYNKYKSKENYLGRPNYYGGIIKFMYKGIIYNK